MEKLEILQSRNPHLQLRSIENPAFKDYGRRLVNWDFSDLVSYMEQTLIPVEGNIYVASVPEMEQTKVKQQLEVTIYGGMEIQIGYCNGTTSHLNGLEYHKGSELNLAMTDLILLLGRVQDLSDGHYDSQQVIGFYLPKGTAIELYATTLHFAPCKVEKLGFKCVVVLPKGTNTPLEYPVSKGTEEADLLFMKNKWLLAHPDRKLLIERGAYPGIRGVNLEVFQ